MRSFVSIRSKLIFNTSLLIGGTLLILLSSIIIINLIAVRKTVDKNKLQIRNALIAKGKLLAKNNSLAMMVMAQDNAFTAIRELVSSTVTADDDLVYGVYMDSDRKAWVFVDHDNPRGMPKQSKPLSDSLSLWAQSLSRLSYKGYSYNSDSVIEFAAPVRTDDEILGCIRYGLSTASMKIMMRAMLADARSATIQALIIIVLISLFSLLVSYIVLRKLASHITMPIGDLSESAKIIAEGNYNVVVERHSNDEIGSLAEHFESMRKTIKKYTEHLQVLIDEKMQQVKDILNNIDQGLLTVNLDGTINNEYSIRANEILKVDDVSASTLRELLRYDNETEAAFTRWFQLVRERYQHVRWPKLARLAPVQELILAGPKETEYISIDYQKICGKNGELLKIMVLAFDETEKRRRAIQMTEERRRHENDVKTILSIVHTPAEELAEFITDTESRLSVVREECGRHLERAIQWRDAHPDTDGYSVPKDTIELVFGNLHTIKGNGGSYDFERLSFLAHEAEGQLERLAEPSHSDQILTKLLESCSELENTLGEIKGKMKLIFGSNEDLTVRIPEVSVEKIIRLGTSLLATTNDPNVRRLADECTHLTWRPAKSILRKYLKLAGKAGRKMLKEITVTIDNENQLYPPDFVADLDEMLVHLVRNAVAHGIESSESREELGKGIGHITLRLDRENGLRKVVVADDGHGIDIEKVAAAAVASGRISQEEMEALSREEKMEMLYLGGVSTSEVLSDISGRGMGMQIVHRNIESLHGKINIQSNVGIGTTITIVVPDRGIDAIVDSDHTLNERTI